MTRNRRNMTRNRQQIFPLRPFATLGRRILRNKLYRRYVGRRRVSHCVTVMYVKRADYVTVIVFEYTIRSNCRLRREFLHLIATNFHFIRMDFYYILYTCSKIIFYTILFGEMLITFLEDRDPVFKSYKFSLSKTY